METALGIGDDGGVMVVGVGHVVVVVVVVVVVGYCRLGGR